MGKVEEIKDKIEESRRLLNFEVDKGTPFSQLYQESIRLDELIEEYLTLQEVQKV